MITVTRLNGEKITINADMVELIEVTPDTVISMVSGKKILVTESAQTVQDKVIEYKRKIFSAPLINTTREEMPKD